MKTEDYVFSQDGNMRCCHRHDFINLQESIAGFGETDELAVIDMLEQEAADLAVAESAAYKRGMEAARQWQPIDTAPRDGTPHLRGLHVVGPHGTSWDVLAGYVDCDGEFVDQFGDDPGWSDEDFTHWLPLPKPPGETDNE